MMGRRRLMTGAVASGIPHHGPRMLPQSDWDYEAAARTIWGEARGENLAGQMAVVHTLCNRVVSGSSLFQRDNCLSSAALQAAQFQLMVPPRSEMHRLVQIATEAVTMHRRGFDLSGGAQFFAGEHCKPDWRHSVRRTTRIGGHVFYALIAS